MKKLLIIFLWLIGIVVSAQYPVTIATIRTVADVPDGTDITTTLNNTISASSDGDVIVLPKGKFKITGTISISGKDVSIIGQGADSINGTLLYKTPTAHNEWMFSYSNTNTDFNSYFFVSGIFFKSKNNSIYSNNGVQFYKNKNWIVSDNSLQYFNTWNFLCYHEDLVTGYNGLVFKNNVYDSYMATMEDLGSLGYGSGAGAYPTNTWIADPEFGTNKFVFIEDNYFFKTRHAVASSGNGKYVFRYNTIQDNWKGSVIDMHGGGAFGNTYSARASEIYNNTAESTLDAYGNIITESTPAGNYSIAIGIRGGEALIYNNTIGNYSSYLALWTEVDGDYPVFTQIGYNSALKYGAGDSGYATDHGDGDVFWWSPVYVEKYPSWETLENQRPTLLVENRDFHNVAKPGYTAYAYPHPYRNYYYSFIDGLNTALNLTISNVNNNSATLTWNDALLEDGYYVYKSTNGVSFTKENTINRNVLTTQVTGLDASTQYWFKIVPYNDTHESTASNTAVIMAGESSQIMLNGKKLFKDGKIVIK